MNLLRKYASVRQRIESRESVYVTHTHTRYMFCLCLARLVCTNVMHTEWIQVEPHLICYRVISWKYDFELKVIVCYVWSFSFSLSLSVHFVKYNNLSWSMFVMCNLIDDTNKHTVDYETTTIHLVISTGTPLAIQSHYKSVSQCALNTQIIWNWTEHIKSPAHTHTCKYTIKFTKNFFLKLKPHRRSSVDGAQFLCDRHFKHIRSNNKKRMHFCLPCVQKHSVSFSLVRLPLSCTLALSLQIPTMWIKSGKKAIQNGDERIIYLKEEQYFVCLILVITHIHTSKADGIQTICRCQWARESSRNQSIRISIDAFSHSISFALSSRFFFV